MLNTISLKGKNALVGGSSRGIGKAIAIELSKLGANITLVSRSPEKLAEVRKELDRDQDQQHDFIVVDFTKPEDLQQSIKRMLIQKPIHILVNNTGGPPAGPIVAADTDAFLAAFSQHLICNQILAKAVIPGMRKANYGRIINIISTSVKQPLNGLGVSNTIRGAVANWSKTLANELGPDGITVNNILPGATGTERLQEIIDNKAKKGNTSQEEVVKAMQGAIPLGRFGRPEEIAAAAAFLASPAASYITGINLPVDGGRTKSL